MDNFSFGVSEVLTQNSRVETPSSNGILLFTRNCSKGTEKVPQSARLTEGDGGGYMFGQCSNRRGAFQTRASLCKIVHC